MLKAKQRTDIVSCLFSELQILSTFMKILALCNSLITLWKVSKYGVFSGLYFPVFGLNTDIYFVNLCINYGCRKIRTRKNSVFGHFSRSDQDKVNKVLFRITWFKTLKMRLKIRFTQRHIQNPVKHLRWSFLQK